MDPTRQGASSDGRREFHFKILTFFSSYDLNLTDLMLIDYAPHLFYSYNHHTCIPQDLNPQPFSWGLPLGTNADITNNFLL